MWVKAPKKRYKKNNRRKGTGGKIRVPARDNFYTFRVFVKGLTIVGMARETGVDQATLARLENGDLQKPHPAVIQKIMKTYDLSVERMKELLLITHL